MDCGETFPWGTWKYTKWIRELGYNFRIVRPKIAVTKIITYCVYKTNFLDIGDEDTYGKWNQLRLEN